VGGQFNLGHCFYIGGGVKLDKKKALRYYSKAAEQGYAEAQCSCGVMYYNGDGVERDAEEAKKFWALASAQNHQGAQANLEKLVAAAFLAASRCGFARRRIATIFALTSGFGVLGTTLAIFFPLRGISL